MNIVLVTLYGDLNFGNRLQHFALQEFLCSLGCKVDNLIYSNEDNFLLKNLIKKSIKSCLCLVDVNKIKNERIKQIVLNEKKSRRIREKFNSQINNKFFVTYGKQNHLIWMKSGKLKSKFNVENYNYGITGSDQVWHHWCPNDSKELLFYYLEFLPSDKRIAYAASFGFKKFEDFNIELHRHGLKGMDSISVREYEMKKMIEDLVERESTVVVDPTLLLTSTQWEKQGKKPVFDLPDHYIFLYFLGEKIEAYQDKIKKVKGQLERKTGYHYEIVDVYNLKEPDYFTITPNEFIYMIKYSDFVMTDSFHGTVFSIIFHKNFLVFSRAQLGTEGMYGRIAGLLTMAGIKNHQYDVHNMELPTFPSYDEVDMRIQEAREMSIVWLKKALNRGWG